MNNQVKFMRLLGALAVVACLAFNLPTPVLAVPSSPAGSTDSSGILGLFPGFQYGVTTEQSGIVWKAVKDSTASTPAAIGKLLYYTGSTWIQSATANLAVPRGMYGIVVIAAPAQGGIALIQTQGFVTASVKTTSTACAATGDVPLASTSTGDLTPTAAASTPGVTWGFCTSVLAGSSAATLIGIFIGGY